MEHNLENEPSFVPVEKSAEAAYNLFLKYKKEHETDISSKEVIKGAFSLLNVAKMFLKFIPEEGERSELKAKIAKEYKALKKA